MNFQWFHLAFTVYTFVFYKQEDRERVKLAFDIEEEEQDLEQVKERPNAKMLERYLLNIIL